MYINLFNEFLANDDTLRVYEEDKLIFTSSKDRLLPLLDYIDGFAPYHQQVVIFDKIMGNAAALLSVKASCREVYSPLGSELAIRTLQKYGIEHHLTTIVPYIQKPDSEDMCPMESLSINKEPEEFYALVRNTIKK
jgi:hypothetical protein